ncbi:MAG: KTSC domain-containing protein [Pseudorhodoplanes sp.]|uniref:KTSC domain-containing protein n=1 Tax=Pseudorhodoplanes sp. TaxID=1934341 RepID=UPI003D124D85
MTVNPRPAPPGFLRGQQSDSFGIRDALYLPEQREMRVTFTSGRTFAYYDVPQALYDAFVASPSRGAFFSIAIRGRFQFHEIAPPSPATHH